MNNFWKKTGWTCLTFLPLIVNVLIQVVMGALFSAVFSVIGVMQGMDIIEATEYVMEQLETYGGILVLSCHVLFLIIFPLWYKFGCGKPRPKVVNPLPILTGKCLLVTVILSFGLCLFAQAFVFLGTFVAPKAIENYMELVEAAGLGVDPFTILASVILAPIGEEIICRGITFHYAKKVVADMQNRRVAFWIANTLQALAFGIMHMNWVQGTYAFILGLGIGWLRERYNSLYPAILAHAIVNFTSTFLMEYILAPVPETCPAAVILMVVSITITAVAVVLEQKLGAKESA